jgi:hypothetical protein
MRTWVLLCAAVVVGQFACRPSKGRPEPLADEAAPALAAPVAAEPEAALQVAPARAPGLLSLLTLGVAVVGAVSGHASTGPYDADAQLAARIVETTAQLEDAASRVADHRTRAVPTPARP